MNSLLITAIILGCLFAAILLGICIRRRLPGHHLNAETKETVKLAMGLVATMTALLLGLLISSAKGSYDSERNLVIEMAAKSAFLDRLLTLYGPEAMEARTKLRAAVQDAVWRIWPDVKVPARLDFNIEVGEALYGAIQGLAPTAEVQRSLKSQAATTAIELGHLRSLLVAQSVASLSKPLLVMVVFWLVAIFFSFSLIAPSNATATAGLFVSAVSVASAIFLILELDRPFGGMVQISNEPVLKALGQIRK